MKSLDEIVWAVNPRNDTLAHKFKRTGMTLKVDGQTMTIYPHRAMADKSLTLGSNTDDASVKTAVAYFVFVTKMPASAQPVN